MGGKSNKTTGKINLKNKQKREKGAQRVIKKKIISREELEREEREPEDGS